MAGMMPRFPTLKIQPDGFGGYEWVAAFRDGWSSVGSVRTMSLIQATRFYLRILGYEALATR